MPPYLQLHPQGSSYLNPHLVQAQPSHSWFPRTAEAICALAVIYNTTEMLKIQGQEPIDYQGLCPAL